MSDGGPAIVTLDTICSGCNHSFRNHYLSGEFVTCIECNTCRCFKPPSGNVIRGKLNQLK